MGSYGVSEVCTGAGEQVGGMGMGQVLHQGREPGGQRLVSTMSCGDWGVFRR